MLRTSLVPAIALAALMSGCAGPVDVPAQKTGVTKTGKVSFSFPAEKVTRLDLRSGNASKARVIESDTLSDIVVTARPVGGAGGYHPPPGLDPPWEETKAADWGLSFEARRYGKRLVISSKNEMSYIHHYYALDDVEVAVPKAMKVKLTRRLLDGNGASDLSR